MSSCLKTEIAIRQGSLSHSPPASKCLISDHSVPHHCMLLLIKSLFVPCVPCLHTGLHHSPSLPVSHPRHAQGNTGQLQKCSNECERWRGGKGSRSREFIAAASLSHRRHHTCCPRQCQGVSCCRDQASGKLVQSAQPAICRACQDSIQTLRL